MLCHGAGLPKTAAAPPSTSWPKRVTSSSNESSVWCACALRPMITELQVAAAPPCLTKQCRRHIYSTNILSIFILALRLKYFWVKQTVDFNLFILVLISYAYSILLEFSRASFDHFSFVPCWMSLTTLLQVQNRNFFDICLTFMDKKHSLAFFLCYLFTLS